MKIPVFFSYPTPFLQRQQAFVDSVTYQLISSHFDPITVGVDDDRVTSPMANIRKTMIGSCGLLGVAFRRGFIARGLNKPTSDIPGQATLDISNTWQTSPWPHIEAAMAYQLGLPIMIIRETGVREEGLLNNRITEFYLPPPFNLDRPISEYFNTPEWKQMFTGWKTRVFEFFTHKQSGDQYTNRRSDIGG